MPERNIEFGKHGARDLKGHEAVARRLDAPAGRRPGRMADRVAEHQRT